MKRVVSLSLLALLVGCADSHKLIRTGHEPIKIDTGKNIYLSVPKDGAYGQKIYQGSGMNTSQIIYAALSYHSNKLNEGHEYQNFDDALENALKLNCDYLFFPTILEWEDRATEWSGIPDKVSVKVAVVETASGKTIGSAIIKGKSGIATFGGDHPQDLLPQPVKEYIDSLFEQ